MKAGDAKTPLGGAFEFQSARVAAQSSHCTRCGGFVGRPGVAYGYAGRWCACVLTDGLQQVQLEQPTLPVQRWFVMPPPMQFRVDLLERLFGVVRWDGRHRPVVRVKASSRPIG